MTVEELTSTALALPGVEVLHATEESGAPEVSWGDRFFYVGPDRRMPFATIVEHDYPGWDEESRLDRPGVFRLNIGAGRDAFERVLGFPPAAFGERRDGVDFSRLDEFLPHPAYGPQGWLCILNPGGRRRQEIEGLLAVAHERAPHRPAG
ncbi:MAG: erythromycin esterase [Candidatus Dormibacteraeota bacterium]|nr:erythromycin esterase [Candidatus Dormibacteraeota bacterium]